MLRKLLEEHLKAEPEAASLRELVFAGIACIAGAVRFAIAIELLEEALSGTFLATLVKSQILSILAFQSCSTYICVCNPFFHSPHFRDYAHYVLCDNAQKEYKRCGSNKSRA